MLEMLSKFEGLTSQGMLIIAVFLLYQHIRREDNKSREREQRIRDECDVRIKIMLKTIEDKDKALFDTLGQSKTIIERLNRIDEEKQLK